jgi:hypothetical protein
MSCRLVIAGVGARCIAVERSLGVVSRAVCACWFDGLFNYFGLLRLFLWVRVHCVDALALQVMTCSGWDSSFESKNQFHALSIESTIDLYSSISTPIRFPNRIDMQQ